jgi:hypothetical protein
MDDHCLLCGKPAQHRHHCTGRGSDHLQLDDDLTVPLCRGDHVLVHAALRNQDVDSPLQETSTPERIERRLRRMGVLLARLAEAFPVLNWVAMAAKTVVGWADELHQFVINLDRCTPAWRLADGHG